MGAGGRSGNNAGVRFPKNPSQTKHIFRQKEGHLAEDTFENRKLFIETVNDKNNYKGTDALGINWCAITNTDGTQVWVKERDGIIRDAGINLIPKSWDGVTGFTRAQIGKVINMQMKSAYYAMFDILFEYWKANKLEGLGDMLSDLSPYTFQADDYVSADPAEYADWKDAWTRIVGIEEEGTPLQVFTVACTFLDYYANELNYNLGESRHALQKGLNLKSDEIDMAM
jgi:hypothetical protein